MERVGALRRTTIAVVLLAACGGKPADPIERMIQDVSTAVEDRDAQAVGRRVADDFRGLGGMSRADALSMVGRYFTAYAAVKVQVFDVQRVDPAHLRFRVDFTGKPKDVGGLAGLLPSAAVYQFEVELAGEGDALKVRQASWQAWEPSPSP